MSSVGSLYLRLQVIVQVEKHTKANKKEEKLGPGFANKGREMFNGSMVRAGYCLKQWRAVFTFVWWRSLVKQPALSQPAHYAN
jgi:hypothetical protein